MKYALRFAIFETALALITCSALAQEKQNHWDISKVDVSKLPPAATRQGVSFTKDIEPLFEASCNRCHGETKPHGRLRLDSLEAVLKGGKDGKMVVPGDSAKSLLVAAVARIDDKIAMPPKRRPGRPGGNGSPSGSASDSGAAPGAPPSGEAGAPGNSSAPHRPPAKPLTPEQVGLVRAWIDQGAN